MKTKWIFKAFKTQQDATPYFTKEFTNHSVMKTFSANHSFKEKKKYPNYYSDYLKKTN